MTAHSDMYFLLDVRKVVEIVVIDQTKAFDVVTLS